MINRPAAAIHRYSRAMKNILVLGATGFVGRHVCEKLARLQWRITAPTRRLDNARHILSLPLLLPLEADIHDEATLTRLVAGHDAVVNLVAILHGDAAAFERAHVALPQKLARACAAAGVRRVVHVSALGADAKAPSLYQRSKAAGELALQTAAAAGALDLTVLRPSLIFGREDRSINLFARLQHLLPVMLLASPEAQFQPVWVEDVAQAVVRCLQDRHTIGQTIEACGAEVYTLRQLVQRAGQWAGTNGHQGCPVIGLPAALGRLQARLMELLPGEPLMSRDNLLAMSVPNIASGLHPGLSALGISAAPLSGIAPSYLGVRDMRSGLDTLRRNAASR